MIERIIPSSVEAWLELRAQDITSTEASSLFGCSPYMTAFELWHRKAQRAVVAIEENDRMKWGSRLQDSIAAGLAQDHGWTIRKMIEYVRDTEAGLGASFDFCITESQQVGVASGEIDTTPGAINQLAGTPLYKDIDTCLLEIKNVDSLIFKGGWLINDDKSIEAPPHIEIQVQHQMLVSGLKRAKIAALVGGNRVVLIERVADEKIMAAIKTKAAEFWLSVKSGIAPAPNFALDAEFIGSLYQYAEPGKVLDANGNEEIAALVGQYQKAAADAKAADTLKKAAKAELLTKIGEAEKVIADTFSISAGLIGPQKYEVEKEGYRDFRVFAKKPKAAK